MSNKRKSIGKKLRFEVFKRDSFTCQYCGQSAPDVILHVDHISPVSKGGKNDFLNLITSCQGCNLGKGDRTLSDDTEIQKQRKQLEELNERRLQLEEMLRWREGLEEIDQITINAACDAWNERCGNFNVNKKGASKIKALIKRFELNVVLDGIEKSTDQYLRYEDNEPTQESVELAFSKIAGLCYFIANPESNKREIYYIRGILRNRLNYINERDYMSLMTTAQSKNIDMDSVQEIAKDVRSWTQFKEIIETYNEEHSDGEN